MEYSKLVAVTGLPGLFELLNSKSDGAIVRSIEDNSTRFASSRKHQFSHLESIEVYTVRDNVNLVDVFKAMDASGVSLPDPKDNAQLKSYFEKAFPDLDFERVYNSDLKKMVKWFELLKKMNVELKITEAPVEEAVEEAAPEAEAEKPAKKATKKAKEDTEAAAEEKPAKKAAAKKPKEEGEAKAEKPAKKAAAKKEESGEEAPKKKAAPKKK